jgi:excisionase family DNA binding protein
MELLTTSDAARVLGRAADTVRFYERTGRLKAQRTPGGQRLFKVKDVQALAQTLAPVLKGGQR